MKTVLFIAWSIWGAGVLRLLYFLFRASTDSANTPEAGRALGVFLVLVMLVLASGGGLLLY